MNIKRIILLLSFACLLFPPATVQAAGDGEMAIYPYEWDGVNELTQHWFIYNLAAGISKDDKVAIENLGKTELSVKVYPVDALTTSDGAFALENEDESKDDVGLWVNLPEKNLTLAAGEKKVLDFTITIPEDAEPGEHMGGIIIENAEIKQGELLNLKTRVGVRIYQTVPGDVIKKINLEDIRVEGFYDSIWSVFYDWKASCRLVNEGNVQAQPKIDTLLTSPIFGEMHSFSENINGTIFPGKNVEPEININKTLYFGPHTLTMTVTNEGALPIQKSITFWVVPWKLGLIMAVALLAIWSLVYMGSHGDEKEGAEPFVIATDKTTRNNRSKKSKNLKTKTKKVKSNKKVKKGKK